MELFSFNLYGGDLTNGLFEQVKATMLVTVFVFIGIEGASVYSRYAKERTDVGWATIVGFIGVTGLMVLVTLLPTPCCSAPTSPACASRRWPACWSRWSARGARCSSAPACWCRCSAPTWPGR